jgi:ABC-type nickel/cobalt efflux system permease component RcnA
MVPSPSALLVLLGGIALGRAWFGALLVLAYGIGMAAALVGTGLLLVLARDKVEAWSARRTVLRGSASPWVATAGRLAGWLPRLTAVLVIVVGVSVAARSVATL